ncbi:MAG: hypothetical protein LKF50_07145 [Solobacterium sp.]|jgi:hypothetical protein|nr:hypothetical protein [Solobacterium sp.]
MKELTFEADLNQQLKDPEFKKEWDALQNKRKTMIAEMTQGTETAEKQLPE